MGTRFMDRFVHSIAVATMVANCSFLMSSASSAQAVIRGSLYQDSTGAPIRGTVMLVDPSTNGPVVHVVTDSLGAFELKAPGGTYQLAAVRDGFTSTLSAPINLMRGERMSVRIPIAVGTATHNIVVYEHVRPTPTDTARAQFRAEAIDGGFQRRRATANAGSSFDRDELAQSGMRTLGEFLERLPGVQVGDPVGAASVQMSRSMSSMSGATSRLIVGSACHVGWFLDGHRMDSRLGVDPATDALGSMPLSDLEGVEVFRGLSEMPPEFAEPDLRCGAIALWTRRGP